MVSRPGWVQAASRNVRSTGPAVFNGGSTKRPHGHVTAVTCAGHFEVVLVFMETMLKLIHTGKWRNHWLAFTVKQGLPGNLERCTRPAQPQQQPFLDAP